MESLLNESKVEGAEVQASGAASCGNDAPEIAKLVAERVNEAKDAVSAKLEEGKMAAERLLKRGRHGIEDGISETAQAIKHHPFRSFAIAFAAGAALSFLGLRSARK